MSHYPSPPSHPLLIPTDPSRPTYLRQRRLKLDPPRFEETRENTRYDRQTGSGLKVVVERLIVENARLERLNDLLREEEGGVDYVDDGVYGEGDMVEENEGVTSISNKQDGQMDVKAMRNQTIISTILQSLLQEKSSLESQLELLPNSTMTHSLPPVPSIEPDVAISTTLSTSGDSDTIVLYNLIHSLSAETKHSRNSLITMRKELKNVVEEQVIFERLLNEKIILAVEEAGAEGVDEVERVGDGDRDDIQREDMTEDTSINLDESVIPDHQDDDDPVFLDQEESRGESRSEVLDRVIESSLRRRNDEDEDGGILEGNDVGESRDGLNAIDVEQEGRGEQEGEREGEVTREDDDDEEYEGEESKEYEMIKALRDLRGYVDVLVKYWYENSDLPPPGIYQSPHYQPLNAAPLPTRQLFPRRQNKSNHGQGGDGNESERNVMGVGSVIYLETADDIELDESNGFSKNKNATKSSIVIPKNLKKVVAKSRRDQKRASEPGSTKRSSNRVMKIVLEGERNGNDDGEPTVAAATSVNGGTRTEEGSGAEGSIENGSKRKKPGRKVTGKRKRGDQDEGESERPTVGVVINEDDVYIDGSRASEAGRALEVPRDELSVISVSSNQPQYPLPEHRSHPLTISIDNPNPPLSISLSQPLSNPNTPTTSESHRGVLGDSSQVPQYDNEGYSTQVPYQLQYASRRSQQIGEGEGGEGGDVGVRENAEESQPANDGMHPNDVGLEIDQHDQEQREQAQARAQHQAAQDQAGRLMQALMSNAADVVAGTTNQQHVQSDQFVSNHSSQQVQDVAQGFTGYTDSALRDLQAVAAVGYSEGSDGNGGVGDMDLTQAMSNPGPQHWVTITQEQIPHNDQHWVVQAQENTIPEQGETEVTTPATLEPEICQNCGRKDTTVWRTISANEQKYKVCNACGLHYLRTNVMRPYTMWGDPNSLPKKRKHARPALPRITGRKRGRPRGSVNKSKVKDGLEQGGEGEGEGEEEGGMTEMREEEEMDGIIPIEGEEADEEDDLVPNGLNDASIAHQSGRSEHQPHSEDHTDLNPYPNVVGMNHEDMLVGSEMVDYELNAAQLNEVIQHLAQR